VAAGGVQVPADGAPIVLMADRQATGGYATIAVVASADLGPVAQLLPGSSISFARATVEEAAEAARRREEYLAILEAGLR
jgi:antagonist of KipI